MKSEIFPVFWKQVVSLDPYFLGLVEGLLTMQQQGGFEDVKNNTDDRKKML